MEIERKYLLKEGDEVFSIDFEVSDNPQAIEAKPCSGWLFKESIEIQQGYLDCDSAWHFARYQLGVDVLFPIKEARLRSQKDKITLVFKGAGTLRRHKVEIPIDRETFDKLWPQTEGQRIHKTRFIYQGWKRYGDDYKPHEAKINVYHDRPLIVAEVEFMSIEEAQQMVPIGKDVTEDVKYKNKNLAQ